MFLILTTITSLIHGSMFKLKKSNWYPQILDFRETTQFFLLRTGISGATTRSSYLLKLTLLLLSGLKVNFILASRKTKRNGVKTPMLCLGLWPLIDKTLHLELACLVLFLMLKDHMKVSNVSFKCLTKCRALFNQLWLNIL